MSNPLHSGPALSRQPRGVWRTLSSPDVPLAFGVVAGAVYIFGLWRRLWWAPELLHVALWLALPLAVWSTLRMLAVMPGASLRTGIPVLLVSYLAMVGAQLALVALTLPVLGSREVVVVQQGRWDLGTSSTGAPGICDSTIVGSAPGLLGGKPVSFCADSFPRPMYMIPPVRLTVTHAPYGAWLHEATPIDVTDCGADPQSCRPLR